MKKERKQTRRRYKVTIVTRKKINREFIKSRVNGDIERCIKLQII